MTAPTINRYSPLTGEFIDARLARESPLEPDVYLMPRNTTLIAPPMARTGEAAVFDGEKWSLVEDHRGTQGWSRNTGAPLKIDALGPLPADFTELKPEPEPAEAAAPSLEAIIEEAARAAGVTFDLEAARARLKARQ